MKHMKRKINNIVRLLLVGIAVVLQFGATMPNDGAPPNIIFIVLDDTGIDQWANFGWTEDLYQRAADTPVLDAITDAGIKFTNCWAMPECSPSRTGMFTGRLPLRTGVEAAITTAHLPASMANTAEVMTPFVLQKAGYTCGFTGKWHSGETPYEEQQPTEMGWDWYEGNWLGFVPGIDTTAGQQLQDFDPPEEDYLHGWLPCGTPLGANEETNRGPCCIDSTTCVENVWGMTCLEMGGVPLVTLAQDKKGNYYPTFQSDCSGGCETIVFTETEDGTTARNGYWVWGRQWADRKTGEHGIIDFFHGSMMYTTTDSAIAWLERVDPLSKPSGEPWMLALQYNTAHDPIMPNSPEMVERMEADGVDSSILDCGGYEGIKIVFPYMIEEADKEIGRLLHQRGLGEYDKEGNFILGDLETANTIIAWMGDNGTFYTSTRAPFNPLLSKATVYQTGVWVPLAVAGVGVTQGEVDHPVNVVDVFGMFADVAGVDLDNVVPESHILDVVSITPYLSQPNLPSQREFNYAQSGTGVFNPFVLPQACVINLGSSGVCDDTHFAAEGICVSNGGVWYGVDSDASTYPVTCCDYMENNPDVQPGPDRQFAISMPDNSPGYRMWKLITKQPADCVENLTDYTCLDSLEFYRLPNYIAPYFAALDNPNGAHAITLPENPSDLESTLTEEEYDAFMTLACELKSQWSTADSCRADGNIDGMVNINDLLGVISDWNGNNQELSFFDVTGEDGVPDGKVNITDLLLVIDSWSGNEPCTLDVIYPGTECLFDFAIDCP
jgi:hypothetical protein